MPEKTEAQKRAQRVYMDKFAVVQVRMERSAQEVIKAHAKKQGESVNAFINRAVTETIERERSVDHE